MKQKEINDRALAINKGTFERLGIEWCENCGSHYNLQIAHRKKRRHYLNKDPKVNIANLTAYTEILMLCAVCHDKAEKSPTLTRELFSKLR